MEAPANVAAILPAPPPLKGKRFAVRALAFFIDGVLQVISFLLVQCTTGLVLAILIAIIEAVAKHRVQIDGKGVGGLFLVSCIVLGVLYFTFFEWQYGASPGKILLRMRVVRLSGSSLSFGTALVRSLYRILDSIGFGLIAWVKMKRPLYQRLGDLHTGTVVLSSRDPFIREFPPVWKFFLAAGFYLAATLVVSCALALCMVV